MLWPAYTCKIGLGSSKMAEARHAALWRYGTNE